MRFWDSSAVASLLVEDSHSRRAREIYRDDPNFLVWWSTAVECTSAIARLERSGQLDGSKVKLAFDRLAAASREWQEIEPVETIRAQARRLLRLHPLTAADALQLAAAVAACDFRTPDITFVCFDKRLTDAAEREGFNVEGLSEPLG